jgi:anti-sigma-K factor RskA
MSVEHEELESSVAAYVLGSTDAEDRDRLRAHLEACATCRELAARLARGVSALPLEPEPVQPPQRLEERIVAAAAAARGQAAPTPQRTPRIVVRRPRHVRFRLPGLRGGLAVAAAVLVFAAGAAAGLTLDRWGPFRPGSQPATAEVQRYHFTGTGPMAGVQGSVIYIKQDNVTVVDFKNMPPVDRAHVYELWLITDAGKPLPSGVFTPGSDGSGVVVVDRSLKGIRTLAVTMEPAPDGSLTPSQAPQLAAQVS